MTCLRKYVSPCSLDLPGGHTLPRSRSYPQETAHHLPLPTPHFPTPADSPSNRTVQCSHDLPREHVPLFSSITQIFRGLLERCAPLVISISVPWTCLKDTIVQSFLSPDPPKPLHMPAGYAPPPYLYTPPPPPPPAYLYDTTLLDLPEGHAPPVISTP